MLKVFRKIRSLIKIYGAMHPSGTRQFCGKSGELHMELDDVETHDSHVVRNALKEEESELAGASGYRPLIVMLRNSNEEVVAGIIAVTYWQYLQIASVWIHPKHRAKEHIVRMFEVAEREAARRGCSHAALTTHSFHGLFELLQSLDYEVLGVLEHFPPGHERISMKKTLAGAPEDIRGPEQVGSKVRVRGV